MVGKIRVSCTINFPTAAFCGVRKQKMPDDTLCYIRINKQSRREAKQQKLRTVRGR